MNATRPAITCQVTISLEEGLYLPIRIECACGEIFITDSVSSAEEWTGHHLVKHILKEA